MKIRINVTKEIIQQSVFCGYGNTISKNCAVANAVRCLFPEAAVNMNRIFFNGYERIGFFDYTFEPGTDSKYLPVYVLEWIRSFDQNTSDDRLKMDGISFEVDVPDLLIERIGINQVHEILSKSKTLNIV